ncbi:MAG: Gfo/Idh/MocA family oxidoreductase [Alphaproteobacteria bacterium]
MKPIALAVIGAGLIGRRHAELIAAEPRARLAAVVDPAPGGRELAARLGAPWYARFADLLAAQRPDGAIVATPNRLHVEHGLEAVAAGIPALVEKPLADTVAGAERLAAAADAAGVPVLVGHHRRYNPIVRAAKAVIDEGRLGRILAVHAQFWLLKPDDYFAADWRRAPGAGPVFVNLVHDVDLLRHLCGEIVAVQAAESSAARGYAVEDTAAILLRFASGALGTATVSDAAAAPWSWELTSGENPAYPRQDAGCYRIGGSAGALEIPQMDLWSYPGKRGWWEPLARERLAVAPADPLPLQIRHFCDVIRGRAAPLVPAREGLAALRVIAAIKEAARSGGTVAIV